MLVLTRKVGETVCIGDEIRITVASLDGGQVRLAIEAPDAVPVHRHEIYERIARANREAAQIAPAGGAGPDKEGGASCPTG